MESLWLILFLQGFVFAIFCSFIAKEKNRDSMGWFISGFLFSFLAVLALIAVPKIESNSSNESQNTKTVCPYCKEEVQPDAIICKHCRSDLTEKKPLIVAAEPSKPTSTDNFKIECPQCAEFEEIEITNLANPKLYKKFKTNFSSLSMFIQCNKCGKKIPFNPYKKKQWLREYGGLTSRSS